METTPIKADVDLSIHDKCKQVIMFHNNLIKFLKTLKRTLPETGDQITVAVNYYKTVSRAVYIKEVHSLLDPLIKYIAENDSGIFTDDYATGPRYFLPHFDFRAVWETIEKNVAGDEAEAIRVTIFKHIQALYINCNVALTQIGVFDRNVEKQKQHLMNMLENLRVDDEVRKRIEEMKEGDAEGDFNLDKIASMIGEDNIVLKIARDIANEMDLGLDNVDNPVEAITSLFANGGKKMRELIVTLGDKLEKKIASEEIDSDKFMADAKKASERLESNPIFGSIMKGVGNSMQKLNKVNEVYSGLGPDDQTKYECIPELLQKKSEELTEDEKDLLESFAKEHLSGPEPEPSPAPTATSKNKKKKPKRS